MATCLVTMGGESQGNNPWVKEGVYRDYTKEALRLVNSSEQYFDYHIIFDNNCIKKLSYYTEHKDILDLPSFGAAYKAICLYETMQLVNDNDIIFWTDSNHIFINNPQSLFDATIRNTIYAHDHYKSPYRNKQWTTKDTFINMNCDEKRYWNAHHLHANSMAIYKNNFGVQFVKEFLDNSLTYDIIIGAGKYKNYRGFKEHRQDQSIFSIMIEKYGIPYLEYPTGIIEEIGAISINE